MAAVSVFLILLSIYTAIFTGLPDNPEAEVEFQTTSALLRSGSFALGGTPEATGITRRGFGVVEGADGRHYSVFGPGQAVVALPLYLLGRGMALVWPAVEERHARDTHGGYGRSEYFAHLAVGWRNSLFTALVAYLIVLTGRRLGMRRPAAWLAAVAYGTTTFAWAQARSTLSDVQATFFLFLAFHLIVMCGERFQRLRVPRLHDLMLVGVSLGLALMTRAATAPAVLVVALAGVLVVRVGHRRIGRTFEGWNPPLQKTLLFQVAGLLVPLAAAALWLVAFDAHRFADPLATLRVLEPTLDAPLAGLAGLAVAPGKGLVWMAPGLLLLPWGLGQAEGRDVRLWTRTLAGLAVAVIVPLALQANWHGGWTFGPRHLLPVLPFAWLGFGFALDRRHRWLRPVGTGLCLFGLLVQLPAGLVDSMTHQDLALQAARIEWPAPGGETAEAEDQERLVRIQWDWGFAAPWAHWRILRHRAAGLGEEFKIDDLFRADSVGRLTPSEERETGFRHLAWIDLTERLGGSLWPGALLSVLLLWVGVVLALRSLDRTRL